MRPVTLRMHGFAAFREPTVVDFTGADYFAFVGPTGSGKSTVIDAMTFALYGSVPRWGNRGVVGLALSPTATRGTVALEFEVAGRRYVAARDLRRAASGSVTVREARLELLPPEGSEDGTEVLAAGAPAVSRAVEELLGLPFEQFCMCVVLPQGEFAQFLHVPAAERQKVLTRILGLGVYEQMARQAGLRARDQAQAAELLDSQLGELADATEQATADARHRVGELAGLADRVAAALPELSAHDQAVAAAEQQVGAVRAERDALAGLRAPDGLAELAGRAAEMDEALAGAGRRVAGAEAEDTGARERRDRAPDPEPLRRGRERHAELARLVAGEPGLAEALRAATDRSAAAGTEVDRAETARDRTRVEVERAGAGEAELETEGRSLAAERALLDAPRTPHDAAERDRARAEAADELAAARAGLAGAETAEGEAREAVRTGPDRARLLQARRDHTELAGALRRRDTAREAAERTAAGLAEADTALERAEAELAGADRALAAARREDLAGSLRPGLVLHEPCPVCAQEVHQLPGPAAGGDPTGAAEQRTRHATRDRDTARERQRAAESAHRTAESALAGERATAEALRGRLSDVDGGQLDTLLATAERLAADAEAAQRRTADARRRRDQAERAAREAEGQAEQRLAELHAARDPLVALGAPDVARAVRDGGIAGGWRVLAEWAGAGSATRERRLAGLRTAFTEARARRQEAARLDEQARDRLIEARAAQQRAVRAEQDAAGAHATATRRTAELRTALDGVAEDAELARQLDAVAELDRAARAADTALREARAARAEAQRDAEQLADRLHAGWTELRAARDPLVALGAPAGSGTGGAELSAAWAALTGWADGARADREQRLTGLTGDRERAAADRDRAHRALERDLAEHGVTPPPGRPLAHTAAAAASAALERAHAEVRRIDERRERAGKLVADRDAAREAEQVARMLADLLSSRNFPRWLVASALDTLVDDASRTLRDLSGGQFELTHDDGEFLVLDHTDADSRRPVKTLSGGETFQASLALALALSEQLSGMASAGAARLDSIFLDEGFGTLDETNLDVVAATLENLAAQHDRMVGVITHVPALAERVPVRFVVSRDQRTATITREEVG
jgi:DNA repair protein SbcC/Rad50